MKTSALLVVAGLLSMLPARAHAQQVHLQIQDGRVTLDAQNVPVRQILAEWGRIGGAKIVNAEKIAAVPVTLQLNGVSERQALDTILRNVSGYMLATRQPGTIGASSFDRILILPTSAAPRNTPPANAFSNPGLNRPMPAVQPDPVNAADPEEEPDSDQPDVSDALDTGPQVAQPGVRERMLRMQQLRNGGFNPAGQPAQMPMTFPQTPGTMQTFPGPQGISVQPIGVQPGQVAPSPGNPFGSPAGGSTPGMITPVPESQSPTSPGPQNSPRPPR